MSKETTSQPDILWYIELKKRNICSCHVEKFCQAEKNQRKKFVFPDRREGKQLFYTERSEVKTVFLTEERVKHFF